MAPVPVVKSTDITAIAIDKDKHSSWAVRWAIDNLLSSDPYRDDKSFDPFIILIHVRVMKEAAHANKNGNHDAAHTKFETEMKQLFVPFHGYCARKQVRMKEVILNDVDIVGALISYIQKNNITNIVMGASSRGFLHSWTKKEDVPTALSKHVPNFCSVYVIAKGKSVHVTAATQPPPANTTQNVVARQLSDSASTAATRPPPAYTTHNAVARQLSDPASTAASRRPPAYAREPSFHLETTRFGSDHSTGQSEDHLRQNWGNEGRYVERKSSIEGRKLVNGRLDVERNQEYARALLRDTTITHSNVPSHCMLSPRSPLGYYINQGSDHSGNSSPRPWVDTSDSVISLSSASMIESEMRRLKLELKNTMDMYSTACKEAVSAKAKALEFQEWKMNEAHRFEDAKLSEEAALAQARMERARAQAALEATETSKRLAELEAKRRKELERNVQTEEEEEGNNHSLTNGRVFYRKYDLEDIRTATGNFSDSLKVGEGGYGPVYKAYLDHTPVAVKVLRSDATGGMKQFRQEVEVLSCIRHPNMVLLLGASPESGCLVYEYMDNGSLEDRLFRRENTPVLPWWTRFKIAAEIATGLLFLHQTKPEPLVHRDLKPGNILLDQNYVSKISDVGLARLVPQSVADTVTQYQMTSAAGTFCYIDPEYQQTGLLSTKSDIYSLGVVLLQIITARPPMALTHNMEMAIERGKFRDILDPAVPDWPMKETLEYAQMALRCTELRKRDRPDLGTEILPMLERLREIAYSELDHVRNYESALSFNSHQGSLNRERRLTSSELLPLQGH
ncbi:non-specific serine/threonine protein kinase [Ranunculus cassubicifolius]